MSETARSLAYAELTAPDIPARLSRHSVLCLPIGSIEQHGPHLPLNTDTAIAEHFARQLAEHHSDRDLWVLPALPYGLSLEHTWSAGTVSLNIATLVGLLDVLVGQYVRTTPARQLLIVNGHGGNRGVLEALVQELQDTHALSVCVINPSSLSRVATDNELPEIHAGVRETSLMLAFAPTAVRLDQLPDNHVPDPKQRQTIEQLILRRGATWPWSSDDPSIASLGIIGGDPRKASATIGRTIINDALDASHDVLAQLARRATNTHGTSHASHP